MPRKRSTPATDKSKVTSMAAITLAILREKRIPDDEIFQEYAMPDPEADRAFEAMQVAQRGHVYAPALAVKAELRRLVVRRRP